MWRSVLLGVGLVVGVVLAGVLAGGGSGRPIGDTGVQSNAMTSQARLPYHSVVVRGTRTFKSGELRIPLTVHCPQSGATGFKQVIRTPLKVGTGIFGGSSSGGGMTYVKSQSGAVKITC